MSMITDDEIQKIAKLAKIQIDIKSAETIRRDLENILEFVQQLKDIDTKGVEPTSQVTGLIDVMREDEPIDYGVSPEELLKNAPAQKDGYIQVKRVL